MTWGSHIHAFWSVTMCYWASGTRVRCVWNVLVHPQKLDFVFRRNRRVHLNQRGHQFSWMLATKVCASVLVMLDTPRPEAVWEYWLPTPFASFPFTSLPVCHQVSNALYPTHHCNPEGMTLLFTKQKPESHIMTELNTKLHDLFCHIVLRVNVSDCWSSMHTCMHINLNKRHSTSKNCWL
jgi:hypothetical protein